jgi:uncharacterized protein YjcR
VSLDWEKARLDYEAGCSQSEIAEKLGVSQQRVSQVAKRDNWERQDELVEVVKDMPLLEVSEKQLAKRTPENIVKIIRAYALSGSKSLAAGVVGISRQTLANWAATDDSLVQLMQAERATHLANMASNIAKAAQKDWQAAKYILAHDDMTRDQYGDDRSQDAGPVIVLNIQRS